MRRHKATFTFGVMPWKTIQIAVNEVTSQINLFHTTRYFGKFLTWIQSWEKRL